ncbi:XRE family transcriptional regulator [Pseudomonas aeruginosa]
MSNIFIEVGQRIAQYRRQARLTQGELADALNWGNSGQSRISSYEKGKREPSMGDLSRIARALGVSLGTLISGENSVRADEQVVVLPPYELLGVPLEMIPDGRGLTVGRNWLERYNLSLEHACILHARGSEMEPTILDGDNLILDTRPAGLVSGAIYAIKTMDGSIVLRRLIRPLTSGGWRVSADSAPHLSEAANESDLLALIAGRIVWRGGEI